jgi:hypothetical protein
MGTVSSSLVHTAIVLALLVAMAVLMWWFTRQARETKHFPFRPIAAFQALQGLLGRAAESGKRVHFTLGSAGIGGVHTVAVTAGLDVFRYVADQGAAFGFSPVVTVADPTTMLLAQDVLYRAYRQAGLTSSYRSTDVQLIAPDATAFAVGAQDVINDETVTANVMTGHLGEEYLLMGEPGAQRRITQVVGSDDVGVQPLAVATANRALLGEELFAAGAYLARRPEHLASLRLQDVLRVGIVVAIVIGVVLRTLG